MQNFLAPYSVSPTMKNMLPPDQRGEVSLRDPVGQELRRLLAIPDRDMLIWESQRFQKSGKHHLEIRQYRVVSAGGMEYAIRAHRHQAAGQELAHASFEFRKPGEALRTGAMPYWAATA
jgi:hypothetical protein